MTISSIFGYLIIKGSFQLLLWYWEIYVTTMIWYIHNWECCTSNWSARSGSFTTSSLNIVNNMSQVHGCLLVSYQSWKRPMKLFSSMSLSFGYQLWANFFHAEDRIFGQICCCIVHTHKIIYNDHVINLRIIIKTTITISLIYIIFIYMCLFNIVYLFTLILYI